MKCAVLHGVDVEFDIFFEKTAKGFKDAAIEFFVVGVIKNGKKVIDTHDHTDFAICVAAEVGTEAEVFWVVGDEDIVAEGGEDFDAGDEVLEIKSCGEEVVHCDFHEDDDILAHDIGFLEEL